jgi:hypothetical protein
MAAKNVFPSDPADGLYRCRQAPISHIGTVVRRWLFTNKGVIAAEFNFGE